MTNQLKSLPSLPKLPKIKRVVKCECGCGELTGNRFAVGHDSKLNARIKRVTAGVFDPEHATDPIAQLDAATSWLKVSEVEAMAAHLKIDWTEEAWIERADKATQATGTDN